MVEPGGRFSSKAISELTTARTRPVCVSMTMIVPRRSPSAAVAACARRWSRWSSLADSANEAENGEYLVDLSEMLPSETTTQIVTALKRTRRVELGQRAWRRTLAVTLRVSSVRATGPGESRASIKRPRLQVGAGLRAG